MSMTRRRFTPEFKAEAVRFHQSNDFSYAESARQLGISATSLSRWVEQAEVDVGKGPAGALTTEERREFRQLKRENRRLRMEAEILKNAAAFFAKEML